MKNPSFGSIVLALAAVLAGCSGGTQNSGDNHPDATPMSLQGVVHGGRAPIVGTSVTLYAASLQGQAAATAVSTATTDSNGAYTFSFICPSPTAQMYITGTSGNPGGGVNSAIHLMSILGPCQSLHSASTLNELTTVAAAYVANGFIGPSGCADCGGGLPVNVDNIRGPAPGLPNAFGNAALLVNSVTGLDAPLLPISADCPSSGTVPANCLTVKKLNTVANALAACVNSTGPSSSQCTQLFDCATVGAAGTSGTSCAPPSGAALPADTLQAVLNIARNPGKVSLVGIANTANRDAVFSPASSTSFTDFTLSLNLTAGGLGSPQNIAVDGAGDIWITNYGHNSVTELSPNGVPLSGSGFGVGSAPVGIAFDTRGNAWVSNRSGSSLSVLNNIGASLFGSPISSGGVNQPIGLAVSPDGDIWVADEISNGVVSRFNATGSAVGSGYSAGNTPVGVAVDASGYVYVSNNGGTITELGPDGTLINTISDASLKTPAGMAIDVNGNLWVANSGGGLTKITLTGANEVSATGITGGGLYYPSGVAIDASGNVWVANSYNSSISEFSSAGTALSPSGGFIGAGIEQGGLEIAPAVDPSGNVWFTNDGSGGNGSVTVFFGAATPTRTPLVNAIAQGFVP